MGTRKLALLGACCAALLVPAQAGATTVTLGPAVPPSSEGSAGCTECGAGLTFAQTGSGHINEVPADGTIRAWRVAGKGTLVLHVLRAGEEEGLAYFGEGVSSPATNLVGGNNPTGLPVHAGDLIGVDVGGPGGAGASVDFETMAGSDYLFFKPALPAFGSAVPTVRYDDELLVSADVVLAPVVSAVSPAQGPDSSGGSVSISGLYLDGATGVSFGATPAKSFTVDSATQITALAPAATAGPVEVHVTGPGGTSAPVAGDRYTFITAAPGPVVAPGAGSPGGGQAGKPVVGALGQSASRWRRGGKLPFISRAGAPVGITFSFSLNEAANVSLVFSRHASGRRVGGRCVAPTPRNASKHRCVRSVAVGGFSLPGHAGVDKVAFQGRLSRTKTLKPGTYTLVLSAHSAGLASSSRSLTFTIVS